MKTNLFRPFRRISFVAGIAITLLGASAEAAIESRSILKTFFETGDVPTQEQFGNLIDSFIHTTDDGFDLTGIGAFPNGSAAGLAMRVGGNVGINESLPATFSGGWKPYQTPPTSPTPQMCSQFCGTSGFLPLKYTGSDGPHFGFLQVDMGASPGAGIYVTQLVWESSPNTTLTTFAVPEPATLALMLLALPALVRRRR